VRPKRILRHNVTRCMNLDLCNFCEGFFHVEESVEMKLPDTCLCNKMCLRKSVTCIARITQETTGAEMFVSAYKNRKEFGNYRTHAEKIMICDLECLNAIRSSHDARIMTLYLTYQPCHFSGGHTRPSAISCTEELVRYKESVLEKHNVKLKIKIAYIYRAFWDLRNSERKYWQMIQNARIGIQRLHYHNISLHAFDETDWALILTFCSNETRTKIGNIESFKQARREHCDAFNHKFLQDFN